MNISVFGGSSPRPDSAAYQDAYELGKKLASLGHTLMNGGYMGTMEAVSRGAAQAGGQVVGITCDEIESWRPAKPNQWLTQEIRYPTLQQRIVHLACNCDIAIALPGGIGTLTEIACIWNLRVIGVLKSTLLWVVGVGWQRIFDAFFEDMQAYIPAEQKELIRFYGSVNQLIDQINRPM